jgi:hypothetical protein
MRLALALSLLAAMATPNAPVSVLKTHPHYGPHLECRSGGVGCFESGTVDMIIEYRNDSDKEIVGVKFKVSFLDDVGDRHAAVLDYSSDKKLAPGKKYMARWENPYYSDAKGMEASVLKVLFKDGSKWEQQ